MTPAARLQGYLKRQTTANHGTYRKVRWEGRRNAPDCLVSFGFPRVALIEVKAGNDRLSVGQEREIQRFRDDGWSVFVARTEVDIDAIILEVKGNI